MKIVLNGKIIEIQESLTLTEYISLKDLDPMKIVIEYNRNIIKKDDWHNCILTENDSLEVLNFVGGG